MNLEKVTLLLSNHYYFKRYSFLVFTFMFVLLALRFDYAEVITKPAQSLHLWRQTDCLSQTYNYYQDNNHFLEPSVHYLGTDGTGKTVSDFPLIYFTIGKIWQTFGHHEFIYRVFVLFIFYLGLLALFKWLESEIKDSVLAICAVLMLFSSSIITYYASNFLMNIPALSMAMVGGYFFSIYNRKQTNLSLVLFAFCFAIAGLLKAPSMLLFCAIVGCFVLKLLGVKRFDIKAFQKPLPFILAIMGVIASQLIWYWYAKHYNAMYNSGIFLIGIFPMWDMSLEEITDTLDAILIENVWGYYSKVILGLLFLAILVLTYYYKKVNSILLGITMFLLLGGLSYSVLFFKAFRHHDYYTINLFIISPLLMASLFLLMKNKVPNFYNHWLFRCIVIGVLVYSVEFSRMNILYRYRTDRWQNAYYLKKMEAYERIPHYLEGIGVKKSDPVISASDNTINASLYKMNHKGWTNYGLKMHPERVNDKIELGASYMLINAQDSINKSRFNAYLGEQIGVFEHIEVYKIKKPLIN